MTGTPLWGLPEDDRPCPFAAGQYWLGSWQELRDQADAFDTVLNVVIWWDWYPPDDDTPTDTLRLYVAMPGKERVVPWCAPVTRDQEPEIRAWLQQRLRRLTDYWQIGPSPSAEPGQDSPAEQVTRLLGVAARVRQTCHQALAEKDTPGMWLVAQQVLTILEEEGL